MSNKMLSYIPIDPVYLTTYAFWASIITTLLSNTINLYPIVSIIFGVSTTGTIMDIVEKADIIKNIVHHIFPLFLTVLYSYHNNYTTIYNLYISLLLSVTINIIYFNGLNRNKNNINNVYNNYEYYMVSCYIFNMMYNIYLNNSNLALAIS